MIPFSNTYSQLPERFFSRTESAKVSDPRLVRVNEALAKELGIDVDWLKSPEGVAGLSGNEVPDGAEPLSQAYAGHQFGGWVPQLGDGRAVLLGEVIDCHGMRRDLQLKGSGLTPFSRGGDGKATLGSTIREYLVSEAMAALGVPSTRALAVVTTGETVPRQQMHPGAVFTRVAASHLRVGTFQYFYARQDIDSIRLLADYAIERHYPEVAEVDDRYLEFLRKVAEAQANLIAQWMQLGFIHGVMNTDNTTISGETIDYGPCAFMEVFHPDTVFSSIDRYGRYAWSNQPAIGQWNLARLGETLAPLIDEDFDRAKPKIEGVLEDYHRAFKQAHVRGFGEKLGLTESDESFIEDTLEFMAKSKLDFTLFFRHLTRFAGGAIDESELQSVLGEPANLQAWIKSWRAGTDSRQVDRMRRRNPVLIPRNHRVEEAIQAAEAGDFEIFHRLADAYEQPYADRPEFADLENPAAPHEAVTETFCGT